MGNAAAVTAGRNKEIHRMNGKGSTPRNLGPKFRANYNRIFRAGKKRAGKTNT